MLLFYYRQTAFSSYNPTARYHAPVIAYLFNISFRHILRYGLQSVLAVLGVAIGVANIIMLISITDLGKRQTTSLINGMGANLIFIAPFFDMTASPFGSSSGAASIGSFLPGEALDAVAGAQGVVATAGVLLMPGHLDGETGRTFTTLEGISPAFDRFIGIEMEQGRWISQEDIDTRANVVCLGQTVKQSLFGNADAMGKTVRTKDLELTVIGIMEDIGRIGTEDIDNRALIPLNTLQEHLGFNGMTGMVAQFDPEFGEDSALESINGRLEGILKDGEILEETFTVFTIKDATKLRDSTLQIFRAVLAGISSIALLVAGLGIMNVMLIRVMQRRFEIGIRRAVGASRQAIVGQFLIEAVTQAVIGSVFGLALGTAGVFIYSSYAEWAFYVSPWTMLEGCLFSIGVGTLFGWYPAYRASRVDPIETLRTEM